MNGIFYLFISIFSLMLIQGLLAFCTCLASIRLVHSPEEDVERTVLIDRQTDIETRRNSILY